MDRLKVDLIKKIKKKGTSNQIKAQKETSKNIESCA